MRHLAHRKAGVAAILGLVMGGIILVALLTALGLAIYDKLGALDHEENMKHPSSAASPPSRA